jgi:hypothetical protein
MGDRPDTANIEKVILDALTADFDGVRILKVKVFDRSEIGDDETLKIQVVFDGDPKDLDARKVAGAVRSVRPALAAIGEPAFPLFSFVTKGDASRFEPA